MKRTRLAVFFVALGLIVAAGLSYRSQADAQSGGAAAAAPPSFVAVVDVAQLIKAHPEFSKKQEALKNKMIAEEAKFKKRQQDIIQQEKALQSSGLRAGSPEHQKALDTISKLYAEFETDARSMQRRFALENSQIMFDTYQDIKLTIGEFAKARRIAQVTDYRFFKPDPADPQTVAEDMDQKLVWFDDTLNVTKFVIYQMYDVRKIQRPTDAELTKMFEQGNAAPQQPVPQTATPPNAGGARF